MSLDFSSAIEDFRRAHQRAALEEVLARLTGKSVDLLSYEDVRQKLKGQVAEPRGLQEIPLDAIVGSVGRYTDFTRSFLPLKESDKERWARVEMAAFRPAGIPPIEVYQIGQVYFVSDGNHRVSVARQLGATHIQAHVTEVYTRVPLSPAVRPDDLILKAEYADFLERTHLDEIRPEADLSVTVPGQYPALEKYIQFYHDLLSLHQRHDLPYPEAVGRWYDQVYLPVIQIIREKGVLRDLPGRTETDLYLWILEHRDELEEELDWPVRPEAAATDLAEHFGSRPRRILNRLSKKILDAVRPNELKDGPPSGQWRKEQTAAHQVDRLFSDILVPVSGEEIGWQALEQAAQVARREGGRLLGLHVVASDSLKESPQAQAVWAEFNRRCKTAGVPGKLVIEAGVIAHKICERGRWTDLIVVNLAHPPALRLIARLKSGFHTLIRRCPRPILAVPGDWSHLDRALLAYDGSPKAEEALFVATYLSARWSIPLVVVNVIEAGHTTSDTSARAQSYLEAHRVQATIVKETGPVAQAILKTAREHQSDLLIMGGYGFSPVLEAVLGSVVDQVLRTSRQPILICR